MEKLNDLSKRFKYWFLLGFIYFAYSCLKGAEKFLAIGEANEPLVLIQKNLEAVSAYLAGILCIACLVLFLNGLFGDSIGRIQKSRSPVKSKE